ncbi:MAG: replication-relaxation family protein [Stellaceae bacterium]
MDAMAPKLGKRKPAFTRVKPSGFTLTARDEAMILAVARHRCMSSEQIILLLGGGSHQKVLRRLRLLFDAGYLARPSAQKRYFAGATPMVYLVGNRGADLAARKFGLRRAAVDWTAKARTADRGALNHALDTTAFMVAVETACQRAGHLDLIPFDEILATLAPRDTRESPRPYHFPVPVRFEGKPAEVYVIPDRTFGIRDRARPAGRNQKYLFLEMDRGTQPVVRRQLAQSSILRKLLAYGATHREGVHERVYGLNNFRVLFVTTGRTRIDTMIEAYRAHRTTIAASPRLFLFADRAGLLGCPDFFGYEWLDAEGQPHRLLD